MQKLLVGMDWRKFSPGFHPENSGQSSAAMVLQPIIAPSMSLILFITNELKDRLGRLLDTSGKRYGRLKQDAQKGICQEVSKPQP